MVGALRSSKTATVFKVEAKRANLQARGGKREPSSSVARSALVKGVGVELHVAAG